MTGVIELAQTGLVGQITALVAQIETATAAEAKDAYDRMGVAREWAKLQVNAEELAERLAWLEAVILRRVGQLDVKCLPGAQRAAARYFATLDDETMAKLFTDYPARRATTVYNLWSRAQGISQARSRGRKFSHGERTVNVDDDTRIEDALRRAMEYRITSVRQAAAVLIDEYSCAGGLPRTISSIVDEFINDEMADAPCEIGGRSALEADAFRRGLTDAVREAFADAPVTAAGSGIVPAFITVYEEDTDQWLRVPSEFARVADAHQMLALRRGQIASAQRSLKELEECMLGLYDIDNRDGSEYLRTDFNALTRRKVRDQAETENAS